VLFVELRTQTHTHTHIRHPFNLILPFSFDTNQVATCTFEVEKLKSSLAPHTTKSPHSLKLVFTVAKLRSVNPIGVEATVVVIVIHRSRLLRGCGDGLVGQHRQMICVFCDGARRRTIECIGSAGQIGLGIEGDAGGGT